MNTILLLLALSVPTPKWHVGTCINDANHRERWDPPYTYRIEEVGKWNYRVTSWANSMWNRYWESYSFTSLEDYQKVECPK